MTLNIPEIVKAAKKAVKDQSADPNDWLCTDECDEWQDALHDAFLDNPATVLELCEGYRAWQPIETAPKTGVAVLLYQDWRSGHNTILIGHYANGWVTEARCCCGECAEEEVQPNRWMHLPGAPK